MLSKIIEHMMKWSKFDDDRAVRNFVGIIEKLSCGQFKICVKMRFFFSFNKSWENMCSHSLWRNRDEKVFFPFNCFKSLAFFFFLRKEMKLIEFLSYLSFTLGGCVFLAPNHDHNHSIYGIWFVQQNRESVAKCTQFQVC